ncbi:hypothetical protein [Flavobacterium psychrotrophum]|uniref:hypothetical protein n=1 Tax=Flavobacterium psychrotrophum TaxID=2294119 RepID=UPI000E321B58|nr:hypothetical protein [Flavobacterium psychrotrophum]
MKHFYFLLLFISASLMAQVPQGFSYQAVALNSAGHAVASSPVKLRVSILDGSATGSAAYVETHNPTTNNVGLFTLTIGMGTPTSGTFNTVNWAENSKFLKVEIDVANGTNYITVGSSQLLSVPYAMYAGAVAGMGSGSNAGMFTSLYMYGTFNSYNASTAIRMAGSDGFTCYKYLTAGTQVKFIPSQSSTVAYGDGGGYQLATNGAAFPIVSDGIYNVYVRVTGSTNDTNIYSAYFESIAVKVTPSFTNTITPMTYNAGTNTLSCVINVPTYVDATERRFSFIIGSGIFGDNLGNGSIDAGGTEISIPGTGNYRVTLNLNTTGDGSPYTVTAQ